MQKRDKKILVISQSYPFPQRCGFTYRVGDMCKHLSKYFSIHIAVNEEKTPTPLLFSELFDGVHYPEKSEKKILFKEILKKTYLHLQQPHFDDIIYENHNFVELIKKLISIYKFSAIIINTPILGYCAKYIPDKILKIMDTHDIWYQKYLNLKKLGYGDLLSHFRDRNRELNLYRSFDLVLAISLSDLQYLQIHGIKNCIHTPPSFLPLSEPKKEKSSNNPILLYASGQGVFNIDAIEFFTKNILPIINEKIKDLKFKILNPSSELQKKYIYHSNIIFSPYTDHLEKEYDSADVVVVPLRFANGIKIKVLESFSFGKATILSPAAIQGINFTYFPQKRISIEPDIFAEEIINALYDQEYKEKLIKGGIKTIKEFYNPEACYSELIEKISSTNYIF